MTPFTVVESVAASKREMVGEYRFSLLFTRLVYRLRHRWSDEHWRIWWQLDKSFSNDLREVRGYWQLYELADQRTLGVYGSNIDVGPIFPARIQARLTRQSLQRSIESILRWVNLDGRAAQ